MIIDLYELLQEEDGEKVFSPTYENEKFKTKRESYPVKDCDIKFIFHNDGKKHIAFTSKGYVVLAIPCNKCLEPVDYKINIDSFKDSDLNKTSEQRIADLDETNYLDGTKIDSEVFINNEILVNFPMKVLCSENCKGICNRCGANLNLRSCNCEDAKPGTGMSKILDVFNQFKEV